MAILDYQPGIWREALHLQKGEQPDALILEGTWWRATATENRLSRLSDVRELEFPDMFMGRWKECTVAYCCAYGAARAVEPAHIFAQLGTPLLIQIGTCGSLDVALSTGTVVLPEHCGAQDGISQLYGAGSTVDTDPAWVNRAESALKENAVPTQRVQHLTWPSLFAQSDEMCNQWAQEGYLSVDMETTTVVAVAEYFGVSAVSLLSVWDALPHGRTFMDPLEEEDSIRLNRSNQIVFDVALGLAADAQRQRESG